jgi:Ring finger domain
MDRNRRVFLYVMEFELPLSDDDDDDGNGLTLFQIDQIPIFLGYQMLNGSSCSICLHDFQDHPYESVMYLECDHFFHSSCLLPWFETHSSCPLCRVDLKNFYFPQSVIPFLSNNNDDDDDDDWVSASDMWDISFRTDCSAFDNFSTLMNAENDDDLQSSSTSMKFFSTLDDDIEVNFHNQAHEVESEEELVLEHNNNDMDIDINTTPVVLLEDISNIFGMT